MLILKLRKTNIIMGAHRLHFIVLLVCYLPCLVLSRRLPLAPRIPENFSSFELPSIKDPKIIGGETVKNGEAPYQVAIIRNGAFHCGGVWIDAKRVLTAAHCVIGLVPCCLHLLFTFTNLGFILATNLVLICFAFATELFTEMAVLRWPSVA